MSDKNGTQRVIVNGLLQKDGRVLVAKRSMKKKIAPGKYHLPGGHVEFSEGPIDALEREFKEEFGLTVSAKDVFRSFSYVIDDIHTIGLSFILSSDDDLNEVVVDTDDNEEIVWVDKDSIGSYFEAGDHDFITLSNYFNH